MAFKLRHKPSGLFWVRKRGGLLDERGSVSRIRPSLAWLSGRAFIKGVGRIPIKPDEWEVIDVRIEGMKRFTLRYDESGHSYAIPVEKQGEFEAWVNHWESDSEAEWQGTDFDEYRVEGGWTFVDPRHSDGKEVEE